MPLTHKQALKILNDPGSTAHNRCRHFNGIKNQECKAHVTYNSFRPGRIPCIWRNETRPDTSDKTCPLWERSTPEELINEDIETEALAQESLQIYADILLAESKGLKQVQCKRCNRMINFGRAKYNNHLRAVCATPGCYSMME